VYIHANPLLCNVTEICVFVFTPDLVQDYIANRKWCCSTQQTTVVKPTQMWTRNKTLKRNDNFEISVNLNVQKTSVWSVWKQLIQLHFNCNRCAKLYGTSRSFTYLYGNMQQRHIQRVGKADPMVIGALVATWNKSGIVWGQCRCWKGQPCRTGFERDAGQRYNLDSPDRGWAMGWHPFLAKTLTKGRPRAEAP